jgi:hypothetical protein
MVPHYDFSPKFPIFSTKSAIFHQKFPFSEHFQLKNKHFSTKNSPLALIKGGSLCFFENIWKKHKGLPYIFGVAKITSSLEKSWLRHCPPFIHQEFLKFWEKIIRRTKVFLTKT